VHCQRPAWGRGVAARHWASRTPTCLHLLQQAPAQLLSGPPSYTPLVCAHTPDPPPPCPPLQVRPLITALIESWRTRLLALTANAYSLVTPATLAALLGLSEAEASALAAAQGWRQDMESGAWVPAPPGDTGPGLDGMAQLQALSSYVVHLESS
jgi:hypothetical protein